MFISTYFIRPFLGGGGGGGEVRIQVFIIEGRPVLARGRGNAYVPCGSRAAPKGGGARTESS